MKNRYITLLIGCSFIALMACKKNARLGDNLGGVVFEVVDKDDNQYVVNAEMGIAISQNNLFNGIFVQKGNTDLEGCYKTGYLEEGKYYFYCFYQNNNAQDYISGSVQVKKGEELKVKVKVKAR